VFNEIWAASKGVTVFKTLRKDVRRVAKDGKKELLTIQNYKKSPSDSLEWRTKKRSYKSEP